MSCLKFEIEQCPVEQSLALTPLFTTISGAFITPVFCTCMIAAIGTIAGIRKVVDMQFDVEKNTEFILINELSNINLHIKNVQESF